MQPKIILNYNPSVYAGNSLIYIFGIRMSKPATEIQHKFYLQLRDHNASADGSTPITSASQLKSLVRWQKLL